MSNDTPPMSAIPAFAGPAVSHGSVTVGPVRHFVFYPPDPASPDPVPMIIAFHGGGGTAGIMANALGFNPPPLPPRPYVMVIPQGFDPIADTGEPVDSYGNPVDGVWNSGQSFMSYQGTGPVDDVAFVDALLIEMAALASAQGFRIDQRRTYAIGFSNGGMMALRLAAERSREFAAVVVMNASIGGDPDPADPTLPVHVNHPADHGAEPVALFQIHGLSDETIPLVEGRVPSGPSPRADLPVMEGVNTWVAHNNCDPHPTWASHPRGMMRTWSGGDNNTEVKLLTQPGVGHQVPADIMSDIEPFLLSHSK